MFSKSQLLSTLVSFLVFFFLPWIYYTVNSGFYDNHVLSDTMRSNNELIMWALVVGCLIMAYVFSTILHHWPSGGSNGFKFGALIAILFFGGFSLVIYGTEVRMSLTGFAVDAVFWVICFGLTGYLSSFVIHNKNKE